MLALIDADIVAYRCAATCEGDHEEFIPLSRTNDLVEQILADTGADTYRLFLSADKNFRHDIYPAYKANRKQPPPKWLVACKQFLIGEWDATVTEGCEADDALGVEQSRGIAETVICSIDKDLLQVPGKHYNFVKHEHLTVSTSSGCRRFFEQLLIGDATDNIKGCPGIGKAKAPRILEGCETEEEMFDAVRRTYNNDSAMLLNGKLLWIWRKPNDIWSPSQLTSNSESYIRQEAEQPQESMPQMEVDHTVYTVLGTTT